MTDDLKAAITAIRTGIDIYAKLTKREAAMLNVCHACERQDTLIGELARALIVPEDWVRQLTSSTNDADEQSEMLDWLAQVRELLARPEVATHLKD